MAKTRKTKPSRVNVISLLVQTQKSCLADFQNKKGFLAMLEIWIIKEIAELEYRIDALQIKRKEVIKNIIDRVLYQKFSYVQLSNVLKNLSLAVMALFLQACVPFGLYQNAYNAGVGFFNPKPFEVSLKVKAIPYAMQIVEHEGKSTVMVLAYAESNRLAWVDAENHGFTTFHGKIVSSNGLANDIDSIHPPDLSVVFNNLMLDSKSTLENQSLVRFLKPATNYLEAFHSFKLKEPKLNSKFKRTLDGKEFSYVIVEEKVRVPSVSWSFSNFYWFDLNGNILKSKQYITPEQSRYFLETLKDFNG